MFQVLQNKFSLWLLDKKCSYEKNYYTKNKNHWYMYYSTNTFTMLTTDAIAAC